VALYVDKIAFNRKCIYLKFEVLKSTFMCHNEVTLLFPSTSYLYEVI